MHKFNVATVDFNYIFRLLHSDHHQAAHQKCKYELNVHTDSGRLYSITVYWKYFSTNSKHYRCNNFWKAEISSTTCTSNKLLYTPLVHSLVMVTYEL